EYLAERLADGLIPPSLTRLFVESTEGNPFFMIALADHLLARGLLFVEAGTWTLMHGPAEHMLPDSLRAALEPRLERLSSEERKLLETAAAAGVEFTALALADTAADGAGIERVEELCDALEQREDILRRSGEVEWPDGRMSTRYAFRHALYRQVVEQRAAPARRRRLHQEIGERIERAFAQATSRVAPELAAHFERSGDHARAVRYRMEAAGGARARFADQEVKLHLEAALDEVQKLPASAERDRLELGCLHDLGFALFAIEGYSGPGVARSFSALERVALRVGAPDALFIAKGGLFFFHVMRADLKTAEGITREVTAMAEATGSAMLAAAAYTARGSLEYNLGELVEARSRLDQARALLEPVAERFPVDMGVIHLGHLGLTLAQLGFPDQARSMSDAAKRRATSMSPLNVAYSRSLAAHLHAMLRDPAATRSQAEELIGLGVEYGFPVYAAVGTLLRAWAAGRDRRDPDALAAIRAAIEEYTATGQRIGRSFFLTLLADVALRTDAVDVAEEAVREGLAHVAATGEAVHEAELLRLQAECRLRAPGAKPGSAAAEHFAPALAVAQRRHARLVELRIHASICRAIGPGQPASEQARGSLATVLASFGEGLDCADLAEARLLLEG
ncbi:MAG TPA: hypothetical protein VEI94_07600, partial [Candidatus Bathyarchaeia archaeon]|nr:hypothetical protein [Candidatus Bathyarchaeia archaeon]